MVRSKEAGTAGHGNGLSEMFKVGWNGLSKQVLGANVKKWLEQVIGIGCWKRSKKAGTGRWNGWLEMFKER
jgi:hypothetical protein